MITETSPTDTVTAAGTGASATTAFRAGRHEGVEGIDAERVATVVRAVLEGVHGALRAHRVGYPEFQAAKQWMIEVGEGGEWPLFLDVFVEHVVEEIVAQQQHGTNGTILGPFYLPDQVRLPSIAALPTRAGEKGTTLVLAGQVRGLDGSPLGGAEVDIWQADEQGYYSGFAAGVPDGNLRGVVMTDDEGRFEITTVRPAPYRIPTDGPTGTLIEAAGWHPWRPAHLHLVVRAAGHRPITTQLYFAGGEWLDSDVAEAVKPELVLDPTEQDDRTQRAEYDFVLEPTS